MGYDIEALGSGVVGEVKLNGQTRASLAAVSCPIAGSI